VFVDVKALTPWAKNPRKNDPAVKAVADSIKRFGFGAPLLARQANGEIIAGHTRLKAAIKLGLTEVPVRYLDLTESEAHALALADNKVGELAEWDDAVLAEVLKGMAEAGDNIEGLGWSSNDIQKMITEPGTEDGEVMEPPAEPITKAGDLWLLGDHRLLCGDSTKTDDVARLMGGAKIDFCFTSPPYNSKDGGYKTDYSGKTKKFYNHQCDDRTEDEWVDFCNNVLCLIASHLASEESPVVWNVMYTANCRSGYGRTMFAGSHGLSVKETICWDKGAGFPTASRGILSRNWELVFVLSTGLRYTTTQGENEPRWAKWDISRPKQQEEHKATFPVDLASRAMSDFGNTGDTVYEPFCGSGTTLIAAEQLSRKCYGMELSPAYCDVIINRWETLTGKKATLDV
jgi:site-specific DNA-methyltransferase (adenine-specific)